jgi:hypothetical protein
MRGSSRTNLTKCVAVQSGGITRSDTAANRRRAGDTTCRKLFVRLSLSTDFDPLHFPNGEGSG